MSSSRQIRAFRVCSRQHGLMVVAIADWGTYDGWYGEREVTTVQQARELCALIEGHEPRGRRLVGFTTSAGHFFAVGLGAGDSCAMYWESAEPPYFQSKGTRAAEERIDFAYGGQHTELPGTVRISRDSAFGGLDEFIETGSRPKCIDWEET